MAQVVFPRHSHQPTDCRLAVLNLTPHRKRRCRTADSALLVRAGQTCDLGKSAAKNAEISDALKAISCYIDAVKRQLQFRSSLRLLGRSRLSY